MWNRSSNLLYPSFSVKESAAADPRKVGDHEETETAAGTSEAPLDEKDKTLGLPRDPLNWFGILVPPALRASQSSFKSAVIDTIPALASTENEMRKVEIEVRRVRKRLKKAS